MQVQSHLYFITIQHQDLYSSIYTAWDSIVLNLMESVCGLLVQGYMIFFITAQMN